MAIKPLPLLLIIVAAAGWFTAGVFWARQSGSVVPPQPSSGFRMPPKEAPGPGWAVIRPGASEISRIDNDILSLTPVRIPNSDEPLVPFRVRLIDRTQLLQTKGTSKKSSELNAELKFYNSLVDRYIATRTTDRWGELLSPLPVVTSPLLPQNLRVGDRLNVEAGPKGPDGIYPALRLVRLPKK